MTDHTQTVTNTVDVGQNATTGTWLAFTTVSNQLNVFGLRPTNKWGDIIWGTDNWGYGMNGVLAGFSVITSNTVNHSDTFRNDVISVVANTVTTTDAVKVHIELSVANGITVTDSPTVSMDISFNNNISTTDAVTLVKEILRTISNSISVTNDLPSEMVKDSSGYFHILEGSDSENAEDRALTIWTDPADPSTTWASATVTPTSWSEL